MTTDANRPPGRRRLRRAARRQRPRLAGLIVLFLIAGGGAVLLGLYLGNQLLGFIPSDSAALGPGGGAAVGEPDIPEPGSGHGEAGSGQGETEDPRPDSGEGAGGSPGGSPDPGEDDEDDSSGTGSGGDGDGDGTGAGSSPDPGSDSDPDDSTPPAAEVFTAAAGPRTLYAVQVGAFSSRANADELVAKLRDAGEAGYIHTDGGYKVWIGLYDSRDAARSAGDDAAPVLDDIDAEFFVQQWVVQREVVLTDVPDDMKELLTEVIAAVPTTVENLSAVWSRTVTGGADAGALAAATRDSITRWQQELASADAPDHLASEVGSLLGFYTRAATYSASLAASASGEAGLGEFGTLMDEHMDLAGEAAALLRSLGAR